MSSVVETFEKQVKSIKDSDYGDFMRKANTYLNRMLEGMQNITPETKKLLIELKSLIQYSPLRNIDDCLVDILTLTKKLKH